MPCFAVRRHVLPKLFRLWLPKDACRPSVAAVEPTERHVPSGCSAPAGLQPPSVLPRQDSRDPPVCFASGEPSGVIGPRRPGRNDRLAAPPRGIPMHMPTRTAPAPRRGGRRPGTPRPLEGTAVLRGASSGCGRCGAGFAPNVSNAAQAKHKYTSGASATSPSDTSVWPTSACSSGRQFVRPGGAGNPRHGHQLDSRMHLGVDVGPSCGRFRADLGSMLFRCGVEFCLV